jgi:hypothetical protein
MLGEDGLKLLLRAPHAATAHTVAIAIKMCVSVAREPD